MKRKEKTTDTVIRSETRERDGLFYKYELIMKEGARVVSWGIPLYSISVEFTDADGVSTKSNAKEIFADVGKAIDFFDKLVENLATPIDLPYIIEDELFSKR